MTPRTGMTVRQAAFIGVGAMVGAGIFSLLAPAGEVAGAAVWVAFLIAGFIAALQGYSFGRLGSAFPSGAGLIEYIERGFGDGHTSGIMAWLVFGSNMIVTAMVAVSFGGYASSLFAGDSAQWARLFALAIVVLMALVNIVGVGAVTKAQGLIVRVVIGILVLFSVVTLWNADWSLLAPSGYPSIRLIISSVALTFFAFLGFGVITFTAKDLGDPKRELPRAMYLALGIATAVYVAIALGVFGTLTVNEVVDAGATAVAEAARPALGDLGYTLMAVTALFATAGATNSGLYPAIGVSQDLAAKGLFPPLMGGTWGKVPVGLALMVLPTLVLVTFFDLSAIASLGSAIALMIFALVTAGHLRIRAQTGARAWVLALGLLTTLTTLVSFVVTTLVEEPLTLVTIGVLLAVAVALDAWWRHRRSTAAGITRQRPGDVHV